MLELIINDLNAIMVSILIAGIFSCIILDILGYLQKMIGMFFNEAMQRVVRAFEKRANELYR